MPTLTDRYVWAVVRLLPEPQRPELDRELRSLVAEMVDARTGGNGSEPDAASVERDVLVELGDPSLLAARYAERPRALIGPEHFLEYLRVLKLVLVIVVPLVAALAVIGATANEDPTVGSVLGSGLSAVFMAGVQVAFWVTLVYAFADRWKAEDPWTPEALPDAPAVAERPGIADMTFGIVVTVLTAVAIVWQQACGTAPRRSSPFAGGARRRRGSRRLCPVRSAVTSATEQRRSSALSKNVCAPPRRPDPPLAASSSSPHLRMRLPPASLPATNLTRRGQDERSLTAH